MRQTSEIEELLPGVPSFSVPSFAERFCILRRKLLLCRQLFHGCVHRKIDVAAISGGQQEINPCASVTESSTFFWHSPWRLDEKKKKKEEKGKKREQENRKSKKLSAPYVLSLPISARQTRKFETFGKRVQKEGVGPGSGNCKTNILVHQLSLMNTLNVAIAVWRLSRAGCARLLK